MYEGRYTCRPLRGLSFCGFGFYKDCAPDGAGRGKYKPRGLVPFRHRSARGAGLLFEWRNQPRCSRFTMGVAIEKPSFVGDVAVGSRVEQRVAPENENACEGSDPALRPRMVRGPRATKTRMGEKE